MSGRRPLEVLSIAHSYVVRLNRRLADEMTRVAGREIRVTAAAPDFMAGDLRPIPFEPSSGERCHVERVRALLSRRIHVMVYGLRLRALLRRRWDLVHCWEEPYVLAAAQVAWWTPPATPVVVATAQNLRKRYPLPLRLTESAVMRRARGWVAFGKSVEATLLAKRAYRERPHRVIPLGVDLDAFRPDAALRAGVRAELGWPVEGEPVVGYLGRFVPEKGVEVFARTLDRLATPWRALVVGGGAMEPDLRRWAARHGDRVRVITGVPHDGVPRLLNGMDVLCAPSRTTPRWREQFGRMLIEAFACGVPVVASDSGEIPDVVGNAGVVVPEADEHAWTTALADLLESPRRRAALAERALERVRTRYAWPVVARQYVEFFEDLLGTAAVSASSAPSGSRS